MISHRTFLTAASILAFLVVTVAPAGLEAQQFRPQKPILHGKHWVAITGKPMAATAGAMMYMKGGNAVDATCAMLGATSTMWDVLSWGGETQALIYNPNTGRVVGINALGVAPTGATAEFFQERGYRYPPAHGPLSAVTPGTPGGLMVMLAEFGTLSLAEVLEPSMEMARGYPIEAGTANSIRSNRNRIREWKYSSEVYFTHPEDEDNPGPRVGEIFRQPDLLNTLEKLVEAEAQALAEGKSRRDAIYAAYDRFYRGDIAEELVRGTQEEGGQITMEDLDNWQVLLEEPVSTSYKGIDVYKLTVWTQGPVLLQALNMLEELDLKAMGFNSVEYIHALYQVMNLAFADRDFYYGDPYFPPDEPVEGLLSKEYAISRLAEINWMENDPHVKPGDPYPFMNAVNPFKEHLDAWTPTGSDGGLDHMAPGDVPPGERRPPGGGGGVGPRVGAVMNPGDFGPASPGRAFPGPASSGPASPGQASPGPASSGPASPGPADGRGTQWIDPDALYQESLYAGTTSIQAADAEGWVVSVTPSGGWIPAVIAGRTGVGLSQRAQSFVTDPADGPFNVVEPGKRPRVTLTPSLALKEGRPFLSFAVQGGDAQDQNLIQFFLNMVEWGMNVQQATEAPNINSNQMRGSFSEHSSQPGRLLVHESVPEEVREKLRAMGYDLRVSSRTSGPINAIFFDWTNGAFWGGSSNHGDDYGVVW
jgi:gamma-glutamyltranspeptidase / glutathione hydrolase